MIHFCIVTLGGRDVLTVCLASISKYAGDDVSVNIVPLPIDTHDPHAHGIAIDEWRHAWHSAIQPADLVVIMDPDCALLATTWRLELNHAFSDPTVGVWGAGSREDFGLRVHASMMAVRGHVFTSSDCSFRPQASDARWLDTGGDYCRFVAESWKVVPVERGEDWLGEFSCWRYDAGAPMWTHLGGGTHSDPARLTRWQRLRRHHQIRKRRYWIDAVAGHMAHAY